MAESLTDHVQLVRTWPSTVMLLLTPAPRSFGGEHGGDSNELVSWFISHAFLTPGIL